MPNISWARLCLQVIRFGVAAVIVCGLSVHALRQAQAAQSSSPSPSFGEWAASPSSFSAGSTGTEVIVTAPPDECTDDFDKKFGSATVHVQAGLGVTATSSKHSDKCEMTVTLTANSSAAAGTVRLTILDNSQPPVALGHVDITLNSNAPGPTPPGYSGVDATWQVEDYDVVKQNFGQNLANHYLAILIKIGNNTGYNLLLDGVAFETQPVPSACSVSPNCPLPNPIPSETPVLLSGVVAYGETYSSRNTALRALQWASLLTTGFIPFFKNSAHASRYSSAIAIFNGPFTNGFSDQFPDLTVKQLQRLGGSGILGNSNELDNNSSATYLAFLSRSNVCGKSKKLPGCNGDADDMDPQLLTKDLKQLVLGVKIPAANARFQVVTNNKAGAPTELLADKPAIAGVLTEIALSSAPGSNIDLTDAQPVDTNTAHVTLQGIAKTGFDAQVTVHSTQSVTLQFLLKDGSTAQAVIDVTSPTITPTPQGNTITFACKQCISGSDWDSRIQLIWSDASLMIDGKGSSTGETINNINASVLPPQSAHEIIRRLNLLNS